VSPEPHGPAAHGPRRPSTSGPHDVQQASALLARLRTDIEAGLTAHLDVTGARLVKLDSALQPLAAELRAYVAGGKRLRPLLALLGFRAAGGVRTDHVLGAALSLELLHTCALLHDDLIDAASTRRGRPATHRKFARRHAAASWDGDPERYGMAVAILLGDLAFTQADELWQDVDTQPSRLIAGYRVFTVLREEVMAGQYLDLEAAARRTRTRESALRVATLKSGRYSVTRPLEIGARLAGADDALVARLHDFGEPLGRAFQVRDDILGVFGTEGRTGKSTSSDLAEGKRTLLVAETFDRLDSADDRATLSAALGNPDLTSRDVDRARALMRSSGGLAATEEYVAEQTTLALDALDVLDADRDATDALHVVAAQLANRTS